MIRPLLRAWPLAGSLPLVLVAACTSPDSTQVKAKTATTRERDTEMKHEPCDKDSATAQKVDVNGDGSPDIIHVMKDSREVCRIVDLNLDDAVDAFIYYDAEGRERRRESDFDRDGRADEIVRLKAGVVVLKERETNFDNKIDTWDYYQGDRLVRRERDSDGDKLIDQWWQFNDPTNARCAAVATDQNADGKPDPTNVVDLCGESYGASKQALTAGSAPPAPGSPGASPAAVTVPPTPTPASSPAAPAPPGASKGP
jgi:hypothetical protein